MELLERNDCLNILADRYHDVERGDGHTLFLTGEAGVGKTSLVHHFLKSVTAHASVYNGACDSLFTPRPLGPLYDVASQIGGTFPALLQQEKDRPQLFGAFLQALAAAGQPVVLVFEDIHWADDATFDFIKFLARRIARFRCLFILTFRDDEIPNRHPLKSLFGELTAGTFSKLALHRLSREAVDQLARAKGYSSGEAVYALTGGNPFYVSEILASYSPGIPERVKDAILAVFHSKDDRMQALWELLSILPSRIEFDLVEAIERDFPNGIADCLRSGVIVDRHDYLSFKHELYRLTIEESLSPYRRKALHRTLLKILLERPANANTLSQLIHHARLADDRDLVARLAPQAAREAAALGAHTEASKLYQTAIEYTPATDPDIVAMYENHAYECYLTNQVTAAITSQQQALDIWRKRNTPLKEGDTLRFLSRLCWFEGNRGQALMLAMQAIDVLEKLPPSRELALAYSNQAQLAMLADDRTTTMHWGLQAIALAIRLGDEEIRAHALNNVGTALHRRVDSRAEGEKKLKESLAIALKNGLHEHAARAYCNLSINFMVVKQHEKAQAAFQEGLKYCEERDLNSWTYYMLSHKINLLLQTGAWVEAETLALQMRSNPFHPPIVAIGVLFALARLRIRQGAFEEARALIHEGKDKAMPTSEAQRIAPMLATELELCWHTGEGPPASELALAETTLFPNKSHSWYYTELAYWMHKCGLYIPGNDDVKYMGPFVHEVDGHWLAAAEAWKDLGCAYEAALALYEIDEAHQKQALLMLDAMGATATHRILKSRLKLKGVRHIPRGPRESTRNNPAQLTGRQIEILMLLRDGSQNKEIADKLFISPKTVDHHISAILSKLEVTTRAKAVLEAKKLGILD
jgi:DNA-binding CsgD family transcriptional regulator/tetratricopeptide (TPR) repeat protein